VSPPTTPASAEVLARTSRLSTGPLVSGTCLPFLHISSLYSLHICRRSLFQLHSLTSTSHPSVRVLTIIDDTYEGTVYSYDPLTSTLALAQNPTSSAPNSPADYRILKISFLKEVTVLGNPNKQQRSNTPFTNAEPKIGPVNLNMLGGKEKETAKSEAVRVANIGVGVTAEAQEIYDALSRL
jgi:hypothetical protein